MALNQLQKKALNEAKNKQSCARSELHKLASQVRDINTMIADLRTRVNDPVLTTAHMMIGKLSTAPALDLLHQGDDWIDSVLGE